MLQTNVKKKRLILFDATSPFCKDIFLRKAHLWTSLCVHICCAKKVRDQLNSLAVDYNRKTDRLNNNTRSSYVTIELIIQTI